MIIQYRKHIPGCPNEYCEPVTIGVCQADIYEGMLRFRCLKKETIITHDSLWGEDEQLIDQNCCVMLSPGDLIKCGNDVVQLTGLNQMMKIAEHLNSQLPDLEQYKEYPNRNTPQYNSDTDLYSI